jgi:hypothetical protein
MVIGDGQKMPAAFQPSFDFIKSGLYPWNCVGKEIVSNEKLCQIQEEIDSLNEKLEIGRK